MQRYLGVDLHRTQFMVCVRQAGEVVAEEAMGTTARFYDAVVGRVGRVVVVNPHQF